MITSPPCLSSPVTTPAVSSPALRRAPCLKNCNIFISLSRQQQDIMAVENLILETAVNMAVAKETAKRSVDVLDTDQTSVAVPAAKA